MNVGLVHLSGSIRELLTSAGILGNEPPYHSTQLLNIS